MITAEELRLEELRQRYLELIERPDVFPARKNWEFISAHSMEGLAVALYRKYLAALTIDDNDREQLHDIAIEEFPKYIATVNMAEAAEALYGDIHTARNETLALIRANGLFDANHLIKLIDEGELDFALQVLDVYKPEYDFADIEPMEMLLTRFDCLPMTGRIESRHGIFGSSEKYICPDGHVNPAESEYCKHSDCGKNARGLTEAQEKSILAFSKRITALKSLLSKMEQPS